MWKIARITPFIEVSDEGLVRLNGGEPRRGSWDPKDGKYRVIAKVGGGKIKSFLVSRLICEAFHGPPPVGKPYALHRDEDGANNAAGNLYWGSQKENLNAPGFLAYCKSRTGENHPRRKGML